MISRCGLLKKRDDMTMEEFRDFWFNVHGPIAAQMKNLKHYQQHVVVDREQRHQLPRGGVEIDGYSELFFDDIASMEEGVASLAGAGSNDLPNFSSDCKLLLFIKKTDTPVPEELKGQPLLKRMSLVSRGEGVSAEDFQREWWGLHSELVKKIPGYVGYAQNLVIDRIVDGKHVGYDELPIDGMVEFWFKDMEGFNTCFNSREFAETVAHGAKFLGTVSTYMMETAYYPVAAEQ